MIEIVATTAITAVIIAWELRRRIRQWDALRAEIAAAEFENERLLAEIDRLGAELGDVQSRVAGFRYMLRQEGYYGPSNPPDPAPAPPRSPPFGSHAS